MKPKMIFLTSAYPYGKGEKSFVEPELNMFVNEYDVILISHAAKNELPDKNRSILDSRISCYHIGNNISLFNKIIWGLKFFCVKDGWREIKSIIKEKKSILTRLYQSIGFFILAQNELKYLKKLRLLESSEKIFCYSYWYTYYCYAFLFLKKTYPHLKVITRTHGVDLYDERMKGGRQPFKKIMDVRLDGIIFASDYAKEYYIGHYATDRDNRKYTVCRLGVPKRTQQNYSLNDKFVLLSCSYAIPLKRIEIIIKSLSELNTERIHWIHIGDGDCLPELQKSAYDLLDSKENITFEFKGYQTSQQIVALYQERKIDSFITTSSTEGGCPVSIQEALSFGVPVIGTNVGGITEMIHKNGVLLSENPSICEVAQAIRMMYYMKTDEKKNLSDNAYLMWKTYFDQERNLEHLRQTVRKMEGAS